MSEITEQNQDRLIIVIPAYNEEENIENVVAQWHPIVEKTGEDSRLFVINDGSTDRTQEELDHLQGKYPQLRTVKKENQGHGATILYGYRCAIAEGADYIFQTDSDGQTDPAEFEEFWEAREKYDAVIGNRIERGDGKDRKFVENIVCLLLRMIFGVKIEDANAPFRLMKTSLVEKYIGKLPKNFNIPNIMFTTYFVYHHEKVIFIPITFKPRQGGVNSINIKKIVKIGWKAVGDFHKLRREINDV